MTVKAEWNSAPSGKAMSYEEFYYRYGAYAKRSASKINGGAPVEVILAFWYFETGKGTNLGTTKFNNLAGINYNRSWRNKLQKAPSPSGEYAIYENLNNFADDYARVLNLKYYDEVRQAFKTADRDDDIRAISASPYSVADYNFTAVQAYIKGFKAVMGGDTSGNYGVDTSGFNLDNAVDGFVKTIPNGISTGAIITALAGAIILLLKD